MDVISPGHKAYVWCVLLRFHLQGAGVWMWGSSYHIGKNKNKQRSKKQISLHNDSNLYYHSQVTRVSSMAIDKKKKKHSVSCNHV